MSKENLRIIFIGTPDFAVETLKKLVVGGFNVVSVVTSPDKPAGRGQKIQMSSVKKYALEKKLNIIQPDNLKDKSFINYIESLKPDLQIVVAFRMLPKEIWSIPKRGTINLHSSLLPNYRGAAPINWSIINGEKKTGVTTFFINEKIDTGNILLQKEFPLDDKITAGELHDKLMVIGSDLVIKTVDAIIKGDIKSKKQSEFNIENIKTANKIFREDCKINWDDDIKNIYNKIRGLNPHPGAWCNVEINDKQFVIKIFDVSICDNDENKNYPTKSIVRDGKKLNVYFKNKIMTIYSLQLSSKSKMNNVDFINGIMHDSTEIKLY